MLIHNGVGGAAIGFWIGRFIGQTIGYGIAAIAALPAFVAGPIAYTAATAGMIGTISPLVESASHITGIAGGIIGGTITGGSIITVEKE